MGQYIDKSALIAEIKRKIKNINLNYVNAGSHPSDFDVNKRLQDGILKNLQALLDFIDTLEVKNPYEQAIQYPSIEDGIKAHAETYSFNIESELFNQLTKEQQKLWRKEIEQAVISGGDAGVELARDVRYKENRL